MERNPNPFNLSESGRETFNKLLSKVNKLRDKVIEQESIHQQTPSFELKRARSSVSYYSGLLEAHDSEVDERVSKVKKEAERRIRKIEEETEKELSFLMEKANSKKDKKEKDLKEAEEKLRIEESKVPRSVLTAKSELMSQIKMMLSQLPIPRSYFPELGEPSPPLAPLAPQPPQPPQPSKQLEEWEMPLFGGEKELANMRKLAFQEAAFKEREREEREYNQRQEAIRRLEIERQIQEEQDRKRQDERRRAELQSVPLAPKSIHSSCASEEDDWDDEQHQKDLEECKRLEAERKEKDKLIKQSLLPPLAPPPKKPVKRTMKQLRESKLYQEPDD